MRKLLREFTDLGIKVENGAIAIEDAPVAYVIARFWREREYGLRAEAALYQGREVTLNKPMRGDVKKYKVYVKNDRGNVVKVNFGDPDMEIRRDNPEARKNFRSRMRCDDPGPRWKARYWACRFWSTVPVSELLRG